jgi:hypothetical protein
MAGELFRGVMQWEFTWQGRQAKLPVFYYDNTSLTAIFTASSAAVKKLLPHPDMRLAELYPGKCLAAFTAFEYRKTDIDPYNEFSISFPISFGAPAIPGATIGWQMLNRRFTAYVWQLPVTTEIARIGGVDLYGYPKFLADIVFRREPEWIECKLSEKGQEILTLRGKVLRTLPGKTLRYCTYSMKDGIPLVANVATNPLEFAQTNARDAATLTLGDAHPIATALKGIGLNPLPMMYQYSPLNESILFAGRNLIDD